MRFLALVASAALLVGCQGERRGVEDASATRKDTGAYEVSWTGGDGSVDVFTADEPYVASGKLRRVLTAAKGGQAAVRAESQRRPYFYVTSGKGSGVWTAERVLPLEGASNFRDLGGYRTSDGRRVKWGKVYRSGSMAGLTPADYRYLSSLGIRTICDLRTSEEAAKAPNRWAKDKGIAYWSRDYAISQGQLGKLLTPDVTAAKVKDAMTQGYRAMPFEQASAYREIFDRLAAGEIPLAFNCTAGKDRAGIGAALILAALGVPHETIFADYALSGELVARRKGSDNRSTADMSSKLPKELLAPLMASDPDYIRAAFAEIEKRHGSIHDFLEKQVSVTDAEMATIRRALLE